MLKQVVGEYKSTEDDACCSQQRKFLPGQLAVIRYAFAVGEFFIRSSTTLGSASVLVSPRL
jgi:hypothetical protein